MGGEGSMAHAAVSLKQNRALLKRRNIKELKDLLLEQSGKTELEFKNVSPTELAQIKQEIRKRARKDAKWLIFIYSISLVLSGVIFYFIYWLIETF